MPFTVTSNVHVDRAPNGTVRQIRHLQEPYLASGLSGRSLAARYVQEVAELYQLPPDSLRALNNPFRSTDRMTNEPTSLRFGAENALLGTSTIDFVQTLGDLPIWEAGLNITVQTGPDRVTSSFSTFHHDAKVEFPEGDFHPDTTADLERLLNVGTREGKVEITSQRRLIYRYEAALRIDPGAVDVLIPLQAPSPTLQLPPVPQEIMDGSHYVVAEVLFTTDPGHAALNWRVFIEERTGSVLYLRALVACMLGKVFNIDPVSDTGERLTGCSATAILDRIQLPVTLPVIPASPQAPQALTSEFVYVRDFHCLSAAPPTSPPVDFAALKSNSLDFGAVNTFYHVDRFFRLMNDLGIDPNIYFRDTKLPLPVDHLDTTFSPVIPAGGRAFGKPGDRGCLGLGFAYSSLSCAEPVLIGCDQRVAFHECSHLIQYERTHAGRFAFCHSTGDSLAAIFADPQSKAPDRGRSFPFVPLADRRHDRDVCAGWAWGGEKDDVIKDPLGYDREQILSTTQFRLYCSLGGDNHDSAVKTYASNDVLFLIIKAVGVLGLAPALHVDVWVEKLKNADAGVVFGGIPGGTMRKVIEWAFEKQGLNRPLVDVYIDDGRGGDYCYIEPFWNNTDVWNRHSPDGGTMHETPIIGVANHAYVRVKNRGTQSADNVIVAGYHTKPASGLTWPDDWIPMTPPPSLPARSIPPLGSTIVGPFVWTPQFVGHECILMIASADGDKPNTDPSTLLPCATGPTPHWHLVPFDNNIGQRNVAPVAGGGGPAGLLASFHNRSFAARNPFDRAADITLEAVLPDFLMKRGWAVRFTNADGGAFSLPPRGERTVSFTIVPGADFTAEDVPSGKAGRIEIHTRMEGLLIGGMSYQVDPNLLGPPLEEPSARSTQI